MRHRIASLALSLSLSLMLAPALAAADTSVPRPPEGGSGPGAADWKDRCADRVAQARNEAVVEDSSFQEIAKQKWTGKRDIEYSVASLDGGAFQWQAVVVDEGTVPEPKPSGDGWVANYRRFGRKPSDPGWQYLGPKNELVYERHSTDRVRFFRYEKRMNGWVAVLQAAGMSPGTLRVYIDHFTGALNDCLKMAPKR